MSEPITRYDVFCEYDHEVVECEPYGPYVLFEDHERIVAALQAALDVMATRVGEQSDQIDRLEAELKQAGMGDDF